MNDDIPHDEIAQISIYVKYYCKRKNLSLWADDISQEVLLARAQWVPSDTDKHFRFKLAVIEALRTIFGRSTHKNKVYEKKLETKKELMLGSISGTQIESLEYELPSRVKPVEASIFEADCLGIIRKHYARKGPCPEPAIFELDLWFDFGLNELSRMFCVSEVIICKIRNECNAILREEFHKSSS